MGTSRGRAAPRRLTSRQPRAVGPPQAAIPEAVRALFSSSSSLDWTLEAAGVRNTLPFTTTSQPSRSVGPLPVACSERVSGSSVRPQRSPGRAALVPPSPECSSPHRLCSPHGDRSHGGCHSARRARAGSRRATPASKARGGVHGGVLGMDRVDSPDCAPMSPGTSRLAGWNGR